MGKRKAERTEGAAPPKRSLRSRKPKTAGDEHGTPTANHQEAALIQSQDSDKMDSNSQNALVSEVVQQGHADPSDSITNKDATKPDCSLQGKTIPTCAEDSEKINFKSHDALGGPTAEEGVRGREDTDTGPPEAQGNMSPVCEAADPDPLDSAESAQLVHPPSTMETGPLAQPTSTTATIQLVHPSSSAENISQTKVLDHHTATPTHPLKQTEDAEVSGGGGCHEMEARDGSGGESGRLTPAEGEVKGSTEVKLGESLSRHRRESMEEEEENSHRPLKGEEEIGGGRFGPQAQAEVEKVSTEGEKKGGAEVSNAMKEGEEEEQKEEQALNKLKEDVVASTTEMREEEEERRSEDRGEEDETTEKQKDEEDDASQKQEDEKEEISRKQKDEDEASQNQRASVKEEEEEESSQGGDDGAAVATGRVAPKRKRMGMGVRRRMGMGRPSERERKTHADGQTSEKEKKTPADGQTSEKEKKTPADGQTSEKDRKTPADEQTMEEKKTPADGETSEKDRKTPADEQTMEEKKTPADGETSGRRSVGGVGGGVDGDEGEVERERTCGMEEEEKNSVSEMEEARGEMEREKNEGMVEMERSSVAEMEEGGREMEREKSRGATRRREFCHWPLYDQM
ncbi:myb-like protein X [Engraulis encrasicolus]|uniref:myb-like protein X n=1 Tax=Engraulis encrasicolus TaxID=184585 RepID=UPI002FD165FC